MKKTVLLITAVFAAALVSCGKAIDFDDNHDTEMDVVQNTDLIQENNTAAPSVTEKVIEKTEPAASQPATQETEPIIETETEIEATEPVTEMFKVDISIPENKELPEKSVIEGFKTVLQEPELPSGCEITSLTQTLNHLGFDVDKMTMALDIMPIDPEGNVVMDEAYIGDPRDNGFGCNANVIVQSADKYFASIDSPCYAADITGTSLDDVFWYVSNGVPVITWATIDLIVTAPENVWTAENGKDLIFNWYQHCVTVYGYDKNSGVVYVADPLKGNVEYPIDRFRASYDIMGDQAVIICGDSSVKGHHITTEAEKLISWKSFNEQQAEKEEAEKASVEAENKANGAKNPASDSNV